MIDINENVFSDLSRTFTSWFVKRLRPNITDSLLRNIHDTVRLNFGFYEPDIEGRQVGGGPRKDY